jgi:hypothetical protein
MRKIKVPFVNILTILVFLPFIQACISSTQLNVIQPGLLTLPPNIDTIAIINRFVPSQNYSGNFQDNGQGFNNNYGNSVFGDLSSFNLSASDSCLGSLFYIMGYSPRFKEELIRKEMVHDGNDFFPPVLSPLVVQNVCTENHSQALVVLEGFYSNSTINTQMHSSQVPYQVPYYVNGVTYYRTYYRTVYYYTATLSVFYSAGFRLYQASDGSMLDEIRIDKSMAFSRDGSSPNTAIASLPGVAFIIAKMAATISVDYAQRIAPLWKSVTRQYFTTSNKFLEQGAQFVDQKNWTEARNAWQQLYNTGKPGQKGLAAFNLALSYEMIEGDLYKARDLASESYQLLYTHNRNGEAATATSYIDTLNARINLIPKLDQQLDK